MAEFIGQGATERTKNSFYTKGLMGRHLIDEVILTTAGTTDDDTVVLASGVSARDTLGKINILADTLTDMVIDIGIRATEVTAFAAVGAAYDDPNALADGVAVTALDGSNILGSGIASFAKYKTLGEHLGLDASFQAYGALEIYATMTTKPTADGSWEHDLFFVSSGTGSE
jgi:hypothetical protein